MAHSPDRESYLRALVAIAVSVFGCNAGSCGGSRPPVPTAPSASTSVPSTAPSPSAATRKPYPLGAVTAVAAPSSLPEVAKALVSKNHRAAADALRVAIDGKKLGSDDVPRAYFLLGRLLSTLKDDDGADAAYARVPEASPLFAYATHRRGVLAAKRGKADDAIALLSKVPDQLPISAERHLAMGDALSVKGEHEKAAAEYAAERKGARWVEASVRWAEEVLASGKSSDALEVALAARRVRFEAPVSGYLARAEEAERKAAALVSPPLPAALGAPSTSEQITLVHALLEAGRAQEALDQASALVAKLPKGKELWCKAATVVARAHEKLRKKAKASDAYGVVAASCLDEVTRSTALYDGAKVALAAKQPAVAIARFAALESAFPKHRLSDDARVRGASILLDSGDPASVTKAEAMLGDVPKDYPLGDMKGEALFRLALPRMKRGEWKEALPYLEKAASFPREEGYFAVGRAAYFLARAKIETGAVEDGLARLRDVVAREPLTFAAAMAYARLCARSEEECAATRKASEAAMAAEPAGDLYGLDRSELESPAFARAVELSRVGEPEAARKELSAAGLLKGTSSPAEIEGQWIAAALFSRVGEAKASHGFPRNRMTEWQRHFPSGKWRAAWELAFPRPYEALVSEAATSNGVPSALIWGVMREESAFDPEAVSPSQAFGLLQLIIPTAATYAKPLKIPSDARALSNPENNIPLGTAFLRKLRVDFPENPGLAVPSYNAGEGATRRWLSPPLAPSFDLWVESIPYDETRKYTKRVLVSFWAYVALYDPGSLHAELRAAAGK